MTKTERIARQLVGKGYLDNDQIRAICLDKLDMRLGWSAGTYKHDIHSSERYVTKIKRVGNKTLLSVIKINRIKHPDDISVIDNLVDYLNDNGKDDTYKNIGKRFNVSITTVKAHWDKIKGHSKPNSLNLLNKVFR